MCIKLLYTALFTNVVLWTSYTVLFLHKHTPFDWLWVLITKLINQVNCKGGKQLAFIDFLYNDWLSKRCIDQKKTTYRLLLTILYYLLVWKTRVSVHPWKICNVKFINVLSRLVVVCFSSLSLFSNLSGGLTGTECSKTAKSVVFLSWGRRRTNKRFTNSNTTSNVDQRQRA